MKSHLVGAAWAALVAFAVIAVTTRVSMLASLAGLPPKV